MSRVCGILAALRNRNSRYNTDDRTEQRNNQSASINDGKTTRTRARKITTLSQIHTADADATQLSSWVASAVCTEFAAQLVGDSLDESEQICQQGSRVASCRRCERTRRQSWPSLQFPVLLSYWGWWQVTTLLKQLSVSIKIDVVKPPWRLISFQFQIVECRPNPSAVVVS